MPYAIQIQRLDSVPLAVIRRQASASELKRVVPECCGLVWNAVRAQQVHGGQARRDLLGLPAFGSRWESRSRDRLSRMATS